MHDPDKSTPLLQSAWSMALSAIMVEREQFIYSLQAFFCYAENNNLVLPFSADKSGGVSFAEFANYLARVSSLSKDDSEPLSPTTPTSDPKEYF